MCWVCDIGCKMLYCNRETLTGTLGNDIFLSLCFLNWSTDSIFHVFNLKEKTSDWWTVYQSISFYMNIMNSHAHVSFHFKLAPCYGAKFSDFFYIACGELVCLPSITFDSFNTLDWLFNEKDIWSYIFFIKLVMFFSLLKLRANGHVRGEFQQQANIPRCLTHVENL